MLLLAIETSCDETAAAVLRDGRTVVSSVVASQIALHAPFGGVVPDLAARSHLRAIGPVVAAALEPVEGGWDAVDAVAVTRGPGLTACLVVGTSFAQAAALARGLPMVGVSHIAGHVWSAVLADAEFEPPFLALVVSGGHTECLLIDAAGRFTEVAATRDDAAGEAFDKVARLLGLGYPGGPAVQRVATTGDPSRFRLPATRVPGAFSFSGLKTAVKYAVRDLPAGELTAAGAPADPQTVADLAAAFQARAVEQLVEGAAAAVERSGVERITVVGGVAANAALRQAVRRRFEGLHLVVPPLELCTDNAAMIGAAGHVRLERHGPDPAGLLVDAGLRDHG